MVTIKATEQKCPRCGHLMRRDGNTPAGRQRYECPDCGKKMSIPAGVSAGRLPQYLRDLREQRGHTPAAVSEHLGHEREWLSRVESGEIALTINDLFALANVYAMRTSELIGGYESAARRPKRPKQERR